MNNIVEKEFLKKELLLVKEKIEKSLNELDASCVNLNDGYNDTPLIKINNSYDKVYEKLVKAHELVVELLNNL